MAALLERLAPPGVRTGVGVVDERHESALPAEERAAVAGAVATRRRQFATGRALLHSLLDDATPIPTADSRRPILPAGTVGSLAHDDGLAVAAVAERAAVVAVGIDVEPVVALDADETALIRRADEGDLDVHVAFVVKEAVYKAWSGLGGDLLDFLDVKVTLHGDAFAATMPDGTSLGGRWGRAAGRTVALCVRPADPRGHGRTGDSGSDPDADGAPSPGSTPAGPTTGRATG